MLRPSVILDKTPAYKWLSLFLVTCLLVVAQPVARNAFGHGGGLDKYGCHAGSQPQHCHNNSGSRGSSGGAGGSSGGLGSIDADIFVPLMVIFAMMMITRQFNETETDFQPLTPDQRRFDIDVSNEALTFLYRFYPPPSEPPPHTLSLKNSHTAAAISARSSSTVNGSSNCPGLSKTSLKSAVCPPLRIIS